jgi:hypothetical protein
MSHITSSVFSFFLIFFVTSKSWLENTLNLDVSIFIYVNFCILLCLNLSSANNYFQYLLKYHFKSLDAYIYSSLLIFSIYQMNVGLDVFSFIAIYALIRCACKTTIESNFFISILYGLLAYAVLTAVGVIFGGIEYLFLDSSLLHEVKTDLSPSPIQIFPMYASSFQYSYNSTAYIIIAALGVLELLSFPAKIKFLFIIMLLPALLLTGAKITFLFLMVTIIIRLLRGVNRLWIYGLVALACLGYLFFIHIIFMASGEAVEGEKYYRDIIFYVYGYDGYWSLFSWLKVQGYNYLGTLGASISGFQDYADGYEPHFLLISLTLFGGIAFSLIVYARVIKNSYLNFTLGIKENIFYPAVAIAFLCESTVWDAHDSIIFWIVISLGSWYKNFYGPHKRQA